jgi:CDP-diacylglycerol---glycerol-3-phosphate 3-phosphatidyltransferase
MNSPVAIPELKKKTLTDYLRKWLKGVAEPVAGFLNRIGMKPNVVTYLGLIGNTIGAILLGTGHIILGGIVVLLFGLMDGLDGTMARLKGESTKFGAFIDSVTDRYSELVILAGLMAYYLQQSDWLACGLVYMSALGSVMVSYIKARAEALGFDARIGILTRVERYLVLAPSLVFNIPMVGLWILAVLSNFTAVQRFAYVRKQWYESLKTTGIEEKQT